MKNDDPRINPADYLDKEIYISRHRYDPTTGKYKKMKPSKSKEARILKRRYGDLSNLNKGYGRMKIGGGYWVRYHSDGTHSITQMTNNGSRFLWKTGQATYPYLNIKECFYDPIRVIKIKTKLGL